MKVVKNLIVALLCLFTTHLMASPVEHLRVTWTDDPSTTANIIWTPGTSRGTSQRLYYGKVDHGRKVSKYEHKIKVKNGKRDDVMKPSMVRLKNLEPDTIYYFIVRAGFTKSKRYYFKTMHNDPTRPFSAVSGGDSRNNRTPRQQANTLVRKLRPDVVFFGGDMTNNGNSRQWNDWFDDWQLTISEDGRVTPIVAARGNHERSNSMVSTLFGTSEGVYYAMNFAGSLFRAYTLNSESGVSGNQATWLKNDLATATNKWKFVQYHRPIRPHVKRKKNREAQYSSWAHSFANYGVDLVSESDAHTVKSTYPIVPSREEGSEEGYIRDDENGAVYIGEGCWGAPLRRNNNAKSWTRASGIFNQIKWMFVYPNTIEVRTVRVSTSKKAQALTKETQFQIPACLDLWTPENGSGQVITIGEQRDSLVQPECRI